MAQRVGNGKWTTEVLTGNGEGYDPKSEGGLIKRGDGDIKRRKSVLREDNGVRRTESELSLSRVQA